MVEKELKNFITEIENKFCDKQNNFSKVQSDCGHTTTAIWGSSPTPVLLLNYLQIKADKIENFRTCFFRDCIL